THPASVINGDVEFSINGIEVGGAALTGSGTATVTVAAAPTGTDIVTATFAAQGDDEASSGTASLIVAPAASQIALSASATQIRLGQNVIFTANVASTTTGMPTGTVVFLNGSAQIGEASLSATGQAILNTQNLPAGTDTITAQYQGDINFQPSTSSSVTVTVADDTLTMAASPTNFTISTGQTGQTTLTLTPKNGFAGTVALSCAGLISGATCQFSSPTVVFAAQTQTPQIVTLVINPNTVAGSGFWFPTNAPPITRLLLLLLGIGAMLLPFLGRRRIAKSVWGTLLVVIFCIGLGSLSGCKNLAVAAPVSDGITVQASMPSSGVVTTAQLQVYMAQ
ncbi:MAG: Ig-like domain-containing protein, partial [Acidobacteriaceae bacterium]